MPTSEEETYSIIFSSLKHPARRKILRMLSEKTMTFSQMLEALAIPSSHLTYHLENLGELVVKGEGGKYKLSSFGKASVSMMKSAEEVPDVYSKRFSALPFRWKSIFAVFMIAVVLLASLSVVQYSAFSQMAGNYSSLQQDYEKVKKENQQLLSWNSSANEAMIMLKDVFQLDISKYQASLISNTAEDRADLGVIEEVSKYSLVNDVSSIELTLRFRNGHFSLFQLNQLEGFPSFPPAYTQPQPTDTLDIASALLDRYIATSGDSYLDEMSRLLASSNETGGDQTLGNTKLTDSSYGNNAEFILQYTDNGSDFSAKSLRIICQNGIVTEFSDDWFLYNIGSTVVNVSRDQAIQIAKNAVKNYSWDAEGVHVSNVGVLEDAVSAFYPHPKADTLTLYPYWYVTLYLDKTYPGNVNIITVGVWADTGGVANIQTSAG
jgi:hypothetical protein